ncbi:MAG: cytochrome c biogenesis protein CcsA [Bacteroidota bacterium]|jgi:heme exporter protein C|nr:cytochrome c biogenesis protein CcsA [Bacteroidota bacterium]
MKFKWWKLLCIFFLLLTFTAGFLIKIPIIGNLHQTARNFFFHIPMWFGQMGLLSLSLGFSIAYLRTENLKYDIYASELAKTGIIFGILGLITGSIWAKYTWGEFWSNDPKQIAAAIAVLIYLAYIVLRGSMTDMDKKARISAVYNIFAYFIYIPLIMILPRLVQSLHPGGMEGAKGGGNPALGGNNLDATMEMVFWPAVFGWLLLGIWISSLKIRLYMLANKNLINE